MVELITWVAHTRAAVASARARRRRRDAVARYHKTAPQLAAWLEEDVPEALTVLQVPAAYRRRFRTTNDLKQLSHEITRTTRVATLFSNETSLLLLASTVLLFGISGVWETERAYLTMEAS